MLTLLATLGCREDTVDDGGGTTAADVDALTRTLADAFRIDIADLDLDLDWTPGSAFDGHAVLSFSMRPDQVQPLFHFDPVLSDDREVQDVLTEVTLDGETLDPYADLAVVQFDGSKQDALEIDREVDPAAPHTLTVDWSLDGDPKSSNGDWLYHAVNDIPGNGNDKLFPTINSPDELARHRIQLRVHDDTPYVALGSGVVAGPVSGGVQAFELDTVREVASYNVLLVAIPASEVTVETFDVGGVPVTVVSDQDEQKRATARARIEDELPGLVRDFGPFPMPSMQVLLYQWADGEEYYGATATGMSSLSHELVHMWWGTSAVERTWRDLWFDEAVNEWYQGRDHVKALPDDFHSDIVGGRTVIEPGFDDRAYGRGAQVVGAVAERMGGDEAMVEFLRDFYERRAFAPFTTDDFLEDLVAATGDEGLRADFETWLYTP